MFDIGWAELAILVSLALIVIGPKDLPRILRQVGQSWQRLRTAILVWRHNLTLFDDEWQQNLEKPPEPIPTTPPRNKPVKARRKTRQTKQ